MGIIRKTSMIGEDAVNQKRKSLINDHVLANQKRKKNQTNRQKIVRRHHHLRVIINYYRQIQTMRLSLMIYPKMMQHRRPILRIATLKNTKVYSMMLEIFPMRVLHLKMQSMRVQKRKKDTKKRKKASQ